MDPMPRAIIPRGAAGVLARAGAGALLTFVITIAIVLCVQAMRERAAATAPPPPVVSFAPATQPAPADPDAAMRVYRESIVPLLDEFDTRNAQAADRALVTLHARISRHRAGVQPFARDVRSWRTRFGVIGRYSSDLWHRVRKTGEAGKVSAYVNEKFRRQVISEEQLQDDVSASLRQFEEDLAANRNRLYAQMSLPLSKIRCQTPLVGEDFDRFREQTGRRADLLTHSMSQDTVVAGIAEFSASWAATDFSQAIAARVVAQILARVGTTMAVEGIEAGGATAGGAAAGGGAGSVAGPAGTIIGLGVGIVVGAAVDWWLSDKFEEKVTGQCNQFLSMLDHRLCEGNQKAPGLRQSFQQTLKLTGQAQREAVRRAMEEIKPI